LIGDSLLYNKNLLVLNVSENILGDLGIYHLLCPLIRKKLKERDITDGISPCLTEEMRQNSKIFINQSRALKKVDIETNLMMI